MISSTKSKVKMFALFKADDTIQDLHFHLLLYWITSIQIDIMLWNNVYLCLKLFWLEKLVLQCSFYHKLFHKIDQDLLDKTLTSSDNWLMYQIDQSNSRET